MGFNRRATWGVALSVGLVAALVGPVQSLAQRSEPEPAPNVSAPSLVEAAGGARVSAELVCSVADGDPFSHELVLAVGTSPDGVRAVLPPLPGSALPAGSTVLGTSATLHVLADDVDVVLSGEEESGDPVLGDATQSLDLPVVTGVGPRRVDGWSVVSLDLSVSTLAGTGDEPRVDELRLECAPAAPGEVVAPLPPVVQEPAAPTSSAAQSPVVAARTSSSTGAVEGTVAIPPGADRLDTYVELLHLSSTDEGRPYWYAAASRRLGPGGRYSFEDVEPGTYTVRVTAYAERRSAVGHAPGVASVAEARRVEVTAGGRSTGVDVAVHWGATLTGTVAVPNGRTVPRWTSVEFSPVDPDEHLSSFSAQVGADGRWTLNDVPEVEGTLRVRVPESSDLAGGHYGGATRQTATRVKLLPKQSRDVGTLRIEVGATVRGSVAALPGKSPEGYGSAYRYEGGPKDDPDSWEFQKEWDVPATGAFVATGLSAGTYRFVFSPADSGMANVWSGGASQWVDASDVVVGAGVSVTVPRVTYLAAATIGGRVTLPSGLDPDDVSVRLDNGNGHTVLFWSLPDDGRWSTSVPPGDWSVSVRASGRSPWYYGGDGRPDTARKITLRPGQTMTNLDVTLPRGASLSGTFAPGTPASEWADIVVHDAETGDWVTSVTPAPSGAWTFPALGPGRYQLTAYEEWGDELWVGGTDRASARVFELRSGDTITGVQVKGAQSANLRGRVEYREGYATGGARVEIQELRGGTWEVATVVTASPWGQFEALLAPGTYRIVAEDYLALSYPTWFPGTTDASDAELVVVTGTSVHRLPALELDGLRYPDATSPRPDHGREPAPVSTYTPTVNPTSTPTSAPTSPVTPTVPPTASTRPSPTSRPTVKPPVIAPLKKLVRVKKPAISGKSRVGRTLKASKGSWRPKKVRVTFQWQMRKGNKAVKVAQGTKAKLKLTRKLRRKQVRVKVTVSAPGYAPVTVVTRWTRSIR